MQDHRWISSFLEAQAAEQNAAQAAVDAGLASTRSQEAEDTADAAAARREARALFSKVQSRITAPEQEKSFSPRVSLDDGDAVDVAPNVEVRAEKRTEKPLPPR